MRKVYKRKKAEAVGGISEHGRSTVDIKCPFCGTVTTAYVWSLHGGGKMCDGYKCEVHLTWTGDACLLFPMLTEKQESVLSEIKQFISAPRGDGWHPSKRTLNSLVKKGFVKYDRFLDRAELGYQLTELGHSYFNGEG